MARLAAIVLLIAAASSHAQEQQPAPPLEVFVKPRGVVTVPLPWAECIENELRLRNLNEYGDPAGTKYSRGDTPDLSSVIAEYREVERHPEVGTLPDDLRSFLARFAYILRQNPDMAHTCFPEEARVQFGATSPPTSDVEREANSDNPAEHRRVR